MAFVAWLPATSSKWVIQGCTRTHKTMRSLGILPCVLSVRLSVHVNKIELVMDIEKVKVKAGRVVTGIDAIQCYPRALIRRFEGIEDDYTEYSSKSTPSPIHHNSKAKHFR